MNVTSLILVPSAALVSATNALAEGNPLTLEHAEGELTRILVMPIITRSEILQALTIRASIYIQLQRYSDAVKDWEAILRLDPGNAETLTRLRGNPSMMTAGGIYRHAPLSPAPHPFARIPSPPGFSPTLPSITLTPERTVSPPLPTISETFYGSRQGAVSEVLLSTSLPFLSPSPEIELGLPSEPLPPYEPREIFRRRHAHSTSVGATRTLNSIKGKIRVTARPTDRFLGFLTITNSSCSTTEGVDWASVFSIPSSGAPMDVTIVNQGGAGHPYPVLGWVVPPSASSNLAEETGHALLTRTSPTPPGALPEPAGNLLHTTNNVQSCVWKYNPFSHHITAQWINPNGSRSNNVICHHPRSKTTYLVSDLDRFKAAVQTRATAVVVDLTFVRGSSS